ncbi:MAG: CHAT domain-containing protein, partial [Bacteroidota bacterium]
FDKNIVSWTDIRNVLKKDEAVVEIVRFRKYGMVPNKFNESVMVPGFTDTVVYVAMIITSNTKDNPEIVLMTNGTDLENKFIKQMRRAVVVYKYEDLDSYDVYWKKIADKLKGISTVYLSLDGVYNQMNVNALLNPQTGKYLLEELDIRIVTNPKDIITYQKQKKKNIENTAVLFGDPKYNIDSTNSTVSIALLPGTREEIKKISLDLKEHQWETKEYMGDSAKESTLKAIVSPRVLHIATHGKFLSDAKKANINLTGGNEKKLNENPLMLSMLLFTGAENTILSPKEKQFDSDDGILTAYEAMNLDLDNTELVILSACETGLGEVRNGEGVYGLQRAFQVAGAKTLIMSLWTVSDEATQELMSNFYTHWLDGMNKRDAFRTAQLELKQKFSSSYYWGAFQMIGE